jgi:hypothetical protein
VPLEGTQSDFSRVAVLDLGGSDSVAAGGSSLQQGFVVNRAVRSSSVATDPARVSTFSFLASRVLGMDRRSSGICLLMRSNALATRKRRPKWAMLGYDREPFVELTVAIGNSLLLLALILTCYLLLDFGG